MAIVGADTVFTRYATPAELLSEMPVRRVTHLEATPIVLQMLCDSPDAPRQPFDPKIMVLTAVAPSQFAILERAGQLGLDVMQVDGPTETNGYPAISTAAVLTRPHVKWGESPCAFVELREGAHVTEAKVIAFCHNNIAHFKVPKTVVVRTLPKTATSKIQKFILQAIERAMGSQA